MRRRNLLIVIATLVIVLGIGGFWVLSAMKGSGSVAGDDERGKAPTTQNAGEVRPQLIETSDTLARYVETQKASELVAEKNMFLPDSVDWNAEILVALKFDSLAARTYMGAHIEDIDGESTYVIELYDVPDGCAVAQVNEMRVAFVKQTSRDTSRPVIIRITANTASCPL